MTEVPSFGSKEVGRTYVVRPAAYVVVLDAQGRVACVKEASGLFLPGGGVQEGESPVVAMQREAREECAYELEGLESLGSAVQFFVSKADIAYELRASFFGGRFGPPTGTRPELALSFLSPESAVQELFHECHRWAVGQAARRNP